MMMRCLLSAAITATATADAPARVKVSVWAFHNEDNPNVPVRFSRDLTAAVAKKAITKKLQGVPMKNQAMASLARALFILSGLRSLAARTFMLLGMGAFLVTIPLRVHGVPAESSVERVGVFDPAPLVPFRGFTNRHGQSCFYRGLGWSPWHATMGWNRTREQQLADLTLVTNMNVNALRTWREFSPALMDDLDEFQLAGLPQIPNLKQPKSEFLGGKPSRSLIWTDPRAIAMIHSNGAGLAAQHQKRKAPFAYLLGNEYSTVGPDESRNYAYGCCDPVTLGAFRSWLEARFRTIEGLNRATGAAWSSFGDVGIPKKGVDPATMMYEYGMFLRATFGRFLRAGHEGIRSVDSRTPVSYARLLSRWDWACEDGDFASQEIQGMNLYFSWGKDWGDYAIRLARLIGPGRPALVTETGFATLGRTAEEFGRLTRQGLWLCAFHPEVFGVFPFSFCDEWYKNGKADNDPGTEKECFFGMVTADRKMKSTGEAMKETYAVFKRFDALLRERASQPVLLLSDQAVDEVFASNRGFYASVAKWLYSEGIDFRMVTSLQPARWKGSCPRLVLVDGMIPVDPDGQSGFVDAILQYLRDGGQILYLSPNPWTGTYPMAKLPAALRDAPEGVPVVFEAGKITVMRQASDPMAWKEAITAFLSTAPQPGFRTRGEPSVYSRVFRTDTQGRFALVLNLSLAPDPLDIPVESREAWDLVASDGARYAPQKGGGLLQSLNTFALFKAR